MDVSLEVLDCVARLSTGAHAIFLYETEQQASKVFGAYVDGALERDESIFFISSSQENLGRFLGLAGSDVPSLEKNALFKYVPLLDFCFQNGHLSQQKASENMRVLLTGLDELRFTGARFIVRTDQCLKYASTQELVRFERELGLSFGGAVSVMCSYDANKFTGVGLGNLLIELIKLHGHGIFKGFVSQSDEQIRRVSTVAT